MRLALFCDHNGPAANSPSPTIPFQVLLCLSYCYAPTSPAAFWIFSPDVAPLLLFLLIPGLLLLNCFCRGPRCIQISSGVLLPSCHKLDPSESYLYCQSLAWADSPQNVTLIYLVYFLSLFFPFFPPYSWPSFVFSESICFMNLMCFPLLLFFFWVIPWLRFSWPMFLQTVQNIPYLYIPTLDVLSQPQRVK